MSKKEDAKWPTTSWFSDYFAIWDKRFSSDTFSTQHLVAIIWALLHRMMVKTERQASLYYHVYFQQGTIDLFFLSGFPVENIYKSQNSRERKRLLFLASFYHFHPLHKMFSLQPLHLSEWFNDERGLQKRIQELYYIFLLSKLL